MKSLSSAMIFAILTATSAALAQQAPSTRPTGQSPQASAYARDREQAQQRVQAAESELKEAEELVNELKARLRAETDLSNVVGSNLPRLTSSLQEQRENLRLEEAAAVGRRQGIEEAIKSFSDQVKKRAASDEVTSELSKLVDVRQAQLERVRTTLKAGTEKESASDDAQVALATARAELAAARQRAAGAATDALDAWNRELLNLAIAGQERRAKLLYVQDRLKVLQPALADVDRLEQADRQRQEFDSERRNAQTNLRNFESHEPAR
jgi:chromosome segregation ATPase